MSKENGGSAFPQSGYSQWAPEGGMSLRDYFAAKALSAMMSNSDAMDAAADGCENDVELMAVLTLRAYSVADAMLAAREVSK